MKDFKTTSVCYNCKKHHPREMCDAKQFFTCSITWIGETYLLCFQDVYIKEDILARVLYDSGSEVNLVTNKFAKKNNLKHEDAYYILAGVDAKPRNYSSKKAGKIYTLPLLTSTGEKITIKALAVEKILCLCKTCCQGRT